MHPTIRSPSLKRYSTSIKDRPNFDEESQKLPEIKLFEKKRSIQENGFDNLSKAREDIALTHHKVVLPKLNIAENGLAYGESCATYRSTNSNASRRTELTERPKLSLTARQNSIGPSDNKRDRELRRNASLSSLSQHAMRSSLLDIPRVNDISSIVEPHIRKVVQKIKILDEKEPVKVRIPKELYFSQEDLKFVKAVEEQFSPRRMNHETKGISRRLME